MTASLVRPKYDVAIAIGGGLNDDGSIPLHVQGRLDRLVELYQEGASGLFLVTERTGAPVMKNSLIESGIPDELILVEGKALDTIDNAYYSRVGYTDPRNLMHPLVVTSNFQMYPRTEGIFGWVLGDGYNPEFEATSDEGLDPEKLRKRQDIEAKIQDFNERVLFPNIGEGDLVAFGSFIFNPEDGLRMEYQEFLDSFERGPDALY